MTFIKRFSDISIHKVTGGIVLSLLKGGFIIAVKAANVFDDDVEAKLGNVACLKLFLYMEFTYILSNFDIPVSSITCCFSRSTFIL